MTSSRSRSGTGSAFDATGAGVTQPRGLGNVALAYATLLTARPDQQVFGDEGHARTKLLEHAEAAVVSAARSNSSEGGNWGGGTWQASLETYGWGLAAYLLRDELSPETLEVAERVIRYEADLLIDKPAADFSPGNTGAEDNGWNTPTPTLAAGWWPDHPNADAWREAAQRMAINSATIAGDPEDTTTIIDGRPLAEWAETENLLPDLTMENHGFFNPIYQQVAPFNVGEAILISRLTDMAVPEAFEFRTEQVYDEVIAPLVTPDGDLLLTHGQDWTAKDYQHLGYLTLMGTHYERPDAAVYASRAREVVTARQASQPDGSFVGQPQLGYESMLAKRLSVAYLMQLHLAPAAETTGDGLAQIEQEREGTHLFADSKFVVHRHDGTVRSVNWTSNKAMAVLVPDGQKHPDDRVFVHYRPGNLIGANATGVSAASCQCEHDGFAVAQIVGNRGHAVASLSNGTMPVLEAGNGTAFPITLERIDGLTGDRPVKGPDGEVAGTQDIPWIDIAGRIGMAVEGGAGVRVQHDLSQGPNRTDQVTGSVAGGDGQRAAMLYADLPIETLESLAAEVTRPETTPGWQAVTGPAPDGTTSVLVARFGGATEQVVELKGGPVLPVPTTVNGATTSWALELDEVAARSYAAPAYLTTSAPVTAWAPTSDVVFVDNQGDQPATLDVTFASGPSMQGPVPADEQSVVVLDGDRALLGPSALLPLVRAAQASTTDAADRHLIKSIDALVAGDPETAVDQALNAVRSTEQDDVSQLVSAAVTDLIGLHLEVPDAIELVRTDEPTTVAATLIYDDDAWRAAQRPRLTMQSSWAETDTAAGTKTGFPPGSELSADLAVEAHPEDDGGTVDVSASVVMGGATITLDEQVSLSAVDPLDASFDSSGVSVGADLNSMTSLDLVNRLSHPVTVAMTVSAPNGLVVQADANQVEVPPRGEASVEFSLRRGGVADGRHEVSVELAAAGIGVPPLRLPVHTSDDPALNTFRSGHPVATASSSQPDYPPTLANDGDDATFWVSSGVAQGEGPTPDRPETWSVDFGGATSVRQVTVTPRTRYGPRSFSIEARVDGAWEELAQVEQDDTRETHVVPRTEADAVRLVITRSYDTAAQTRNVQVASVAVSGEEPLVNVALGAPVTASSSQAGYGPERAVDGSVATFWVSGDGASTSTPQWIEVDLGSSYDLSRVSMTPRPSRFGPRTIKWQIPDGDGGWRTIGSETADPSQPTVTDVSVTTRQIRLLTTEGIDPRNVQIAELQVFAR